jgi:hypothetical protein
MAAGEKFGLLEQAGIKLMEEKTEANMLDNRYKNGRTQMRIVTADRVKIFICSFLGRRGRFISGDIIGTLFKPFQSKFFQAV